MSKSFSTLAAGALLATAAQAQLVNKPLNLELDTKYRAQSALDVGVAGDMAIAGIVMGDGPILLKIAGGISKKQKEVLIALGFQFTENGNIIFKGMSSRSTIENGKTVEARGGGVEVGFYKPIDAVDNISFSFQSGKGIDKYLDTDIQTFTVTNIDQFIRGMQEMQRTTTRTTTQKTDKNFVGHTVEQASLKGGFDMGTNLTGDIVVNYSKVGKNNSNTDVLLGVTGYFPNQNVNASLRGGKDLLAGSANWGVTPATSLSAGVMKARGQDTLFVLGLNHTFGGNMAPVGKKPTSTRESLENRMRNMTVSSDGLGDARLYGSEEKKTTSIERIETEERVVGQVETPTPEQPPVTPEPLDPNAPTISLNGASTMSITVGGTYAELGATCTDDKDATCTVVTTGTVDVSTVGTYTITYTATDTAGNTSTLTRTVNIVSSPDTIPPTITLNGASTVTLTVGDTWSDSGITCNEACATIIGGSVNTSLAGTYTLFYQGRDTAGNMSPVIIRTVVVNPAPVVCPPGTILFPDGTCG